MSCARTIAHYPQSLEGNDYIKSQTRVWRDMGYVVTPAPVKVKTIFVNFFSSRGDVLVLNWFEDRVNYSRYPILEFFRTIFILLAYRVTYSKVVWVRHNLCGHDNKRLLLRGGVELFLTHLSNVKVTHRPFPGFHYMPHPLYSGRDCGADQRDIPFLYFGVVKPYKGLLELLKRWPADKSMLIAGKSSCEQLTQAINDTILNRSLKVEWRNYFIPAKELEDLMQRSRHLVVPHVDDAMLVSGAPYYAMAYGVNVLVRNGDFGKYLANTFDGVELFEVDRIDRALETIKYTSAEIVISRLHSVCGDEVLRRYWSEFI